MSSTAARFVLMIAGIAALSGAVDAYSQVNVNSVIFTFSAKARPVQNVIVTNSSSAPVYVSVKTEAMLDYTKKEIEAAPTDDILVSPKKFSIEANGQRTVRMLLKKPPTEIERGYRVYFIPQPNEFGTNAVTRTEDGRTAVIKIATGVGILVFVDPLQEKVAFNYQRDAQGITFTNSGNVQVYLGDGKTCPNAADLPSTSQDDASPTSRDARHPDAKGCYSLPSKRVYPGTTFRIEVPVRRAVRYLKRVGSDGQYELFDIGISETPAPTSPAQANPPPAKPAPENIPAEDVTQELPKP